MSGLVKSFGPLDAKIAIVGEAPGKEEVAKGRPFVGASGGVLRTVLIDAGIDPASCRMMNIIERKIYNNDFKSQMYDKGGRPSSVLQAGIERLRAEITSLDPNVTIALGGEALTALTRCHGIDKWRGTVHQTSMGKVISTYHPAKILREYDKRPILQIDINRAAELSYTKGFTPPKANIKLSPTVSDVLDLLSSKSIKRVAFDIETLGTTIRSLGLGYSYEDALIIPFMCVQRRYRKSESSLVNPQSENPSYWLPEEELIVVSALQEFFRRTDIEFVAQNFPFDITFLEQSFDITCNNFYMDTMAAHHVCYLELPMALDFLTSVYTYFPHYSTYDAKDDASTWIYNGFDCLSTYQSSYALEKELRSSQQEDLYFNHVHRLIEALTRSQNYGVLIDVKNREKLAKPFQEELEALALDNKSTYGKEINMSSPQQVKAHIKDMGYPIPARYFHYKGRQEYRQTTDTRALTDLLKKYPKERFFRNVINHREKLKFLSTYVKATLDADNRFRTSYNASGTNTGRISSSKTLRNTGGNLQNIPKRSEDKRRASFRRVFIVPNWRKLIHADLSQAEARAVAWLSRDSELIDRFLHEPNFDIHRFTAKRLYGIQNVTSEQRSKAKQCVHSGNYRIGPLQFSYVAKIPTSESTKLLKAYQQRPPIQDWWKRIEDQLKENRTLTTPSPFNRRKIFFGRLDHETFRKATGFVPQSLVGDIVNRAFWILDAVLDPERANLILQVHDEIDIECDKDYAEQVIIAIRNAMTLPITIHKDLPPLTIPVDIAVGDNWYDLEDIK